MMKYTLDPLTIKHFVFIDEICTSILMQKYHIYVFYIF